MTGTLDLREELAGRLHRAAAAQGVETSDYVRPVLEAAAPPEPADGGPSYLARGLTLRNPPIPGRPEGRERPAHSDQRP